MLSYWFPVQQEQVEETKQRGSKNNSVGMPSHAA